MKIVVTEMPANPYVCLFSKYDSIYDVCECSLSYNCSYECSDVSKCAYLEVLEKEKKYQLFCRGVIPATSKFVTDTTDDGYTVEMWPRENPYLKESGEI